MRATSLLVVLGLLSSFGGRAQANPADTFGLGSRSLALGGAVAGGVSDFSANYYNPSGLVLAEQTELSLGLTAVAPELRLDGERSAARHFRAVVFGLVAPGRVFDVPVAFGLAGQLSGDLLARIRTVASNDQRWVFFEDRPEQFFLAANVAVRPTHYLALSGGFGFLASTRAALDLQGVASQPGFAGEDEFDSRLGHEVLAELQSRRYPLFGITVLPDEPLGFGLVYRGESQIELDVDSSFDGAVGLGPVEFPVHYLLESTTVVSFQPRQLVLGATYRGLSQTLVGLDVQWTQWSAYTSPLAATASELSLDSDGLIATPELPAPRALESARLADRLVPRVGVEYEFVATGAARLPVRLGYAFLGTPLEPESTRNLVDADRHVLSFGAGVVGEGPRPLLGESSLDVHVAWSTLVSRTSPGPDGRSRRASGEVLVMGATLGLSL